MRPHIFSSVHGHSLKELGELLIEACPFLSKVQLRNTGLGGWTHINLFGNQGDDQFVVKFPSLTCNFDSNPFEYQFQITTQLYSEQICPEPIMIGNLSDLDEIPFMVTRYISGNIHSTMATFSKRDFDNLFTSLEILSRMNLRNVQTFKTPYEMIEYFLSLFSVDEYLVRTIPKPLLFLIKQSVETIEKIQFDSDAVNWAFKPMHGDLNESNIVFSENKAYLLDFETCCIGSPAFDIAYLYNQAPCSRIVEYSEIIKSNQYSEAEYYEMIPLILVSVITWTIKRLIEIEQGIVERNLCNLEIKEILYSYFLEKLQLLAKII